MIRVVFDGALHDFASVEEMEACLRVEPLTPKERGLIEDCLGFGSVPAVAFDTAFEALTTLRALVVADGEEGLPAARAQAEAARAHAQAVWAARPRRRPFAF